MSQEGHIPEEGSVSAAFRDGPEGWGPALIAAAHF